jgi:hypothetical protein
VCSDCVRKVAIAPAVAADCSMHGGHVIFVISGSSFRWVCSSIPDPKTHASLAAIPYSCWLSWPGAAVAHVLGRAIARAVVK